MKSKRLSTRGGATFALILDAGDEVVGCVSDFALREGLGAARFSAIGAFRAATLAYFDWETKRYVEIPVNEQVEVLVLTGDLAWNNGKPLPHIHVVLGRRDGSTIGGHLRKAIVRPTLELMLSRKRRARTPLRPRDRSPAYRPHAARTRFVTAAAEAPTATRSSRPRPIGSATRPDPPAHGPCVGPNGRHHRMA